MRFGEQLAHPDVEPDLLGEEIELYRKTVAMTDDDIAALADALGVSGDEIRRRNGRIIDRMMDRVRAGQINEDAL